MAPKPPKAYLEDKPTKQTVRLGGHPLNLLSLSQALRIDHGYLSRVCSGERVPSVQYARTIAAALGWTLGDFFEALDARIHS